MRISFVLLWLLSSPAAGQPLAAFQQQILDFHNRERVAVGSAPLRWNGQLERDAIAHAKVLAQSGQLTHAPRQGRGNVRENLSKTPIGWGPTQTMRNWLSERRSFRGGIYPDVCTGGWSQCAHYTQIIWPETTDLGCGMVTSDGFQWFVCRYSPGGNRDGTRLGLVPALSGPGPHDASTSRERLGGPRQAHSQSNIADLCSPTGAEMTKLAAQLRATRDRQQALKAELRELKSAIADIQAGIYDQAKRTFIERLTGIRLGDAPSNEEMMHVMARLKQLAEQLRAEQKYQKDLLAKLENDRARINRLCGDAHGADRPYEPLGDQETSRNPRD